MLRKFCLEAREKRKSNIFKLVFFGILLYFQIQETSNEHKNHREKKQNFQQMQFYQVVSYQSGKMNCDLKRVQNILF